MSSQVSGPINAGVSLTLQNALALGTATFPISLSALIQANLSNGVGIGKANQLYAAQLNVAQGTPQTLDIYALGGGNDAVGNPFTMAQVKLIIIQNLGVSGSAAETDTLTIGGTSSTAALTSLLATNASGIILPGPAATPDSTNTPTMILWAPGDVGWTVGSSTTNHQLVFTSNASGHTIVVKVYIVGSTGT